MHFPGAKHSFGSIDPRFGPCGGQVCEVRTMALAKNDDEDGGKEAPAAPPPSEGDLEDALVGGMKKLNIEIEKKDETLNIEEKDEEEEVRL